MKALYLHTRHTEVITTRQIREKIHELLLVLLFLPSFTCLAFLIQSVRCLTKSKKKSPSGTLMTWRTKHISCVVCIVCYCCSFYWRKLNTLSGVQIIRTSPCRWSSQTDWSLRTIWAEDVQRCCGRSLWPWCSTPLQTPANTNKNNLNSCLYMTHCKKSMKLWGKYEVFMVIMFTIGGLQKGHGQY